MENMHIYLMVWFIGGQDLGQNWETRWPSNVLQFSNSLKQWVMFE